MLQHMTVCESPTSAYDGMSYYLNRGSPYGLLLKNCHVAGSAGHRQRTVFKSRRTTYFPSPPAKRSPFKMTLKGDRGDLSLIRVYGAKLLSP